MSKQAKWMAKEEVLAQFGDLMPELCSSITDGPEFGIDLAYCQAVAHHRASPGHPMAWFSTDDPFLLKYAEIIAARMGLEIVTIAEAARRDALKTYLAMSGGIADA